MTPAAKRLDEHFFIALPRAEAELVKAWPPADVHDPCVCLCPAGRRRQAGQPSARGGEFSSWDPSKRRCSGLWIYSPPCAVFVGPRLHQMKIKRNKKLKKRMGEIRG